MTTNEEILLHEALDRSSMIMNHFDSAFSEHPMREEFLKEIEAAEDALSNLYSEVGNEIADRFSENEE